MDLSQTTKFAKLSKATLQALADGIFYGDLAAISFCVAFVCTETRGIWHGRARAMMCRRMKHISLDRCQSARLVACIVNRLVIGDFSEQFKDQLRLALALDSAALFEAARDCRASKLPYVRAYGEWILKHEAFLAEPGS